MLISVQLKRKLAFALLAGATAFAGLPASAQEAERPEISPMTKVLEARAKAENDRVLGGYATENGEYPFQVALLFSGTLNETATRSSTPSSAAAA